MLHVLWNASEYKHDDNVHTKFTLKGENLFCKPEISFKLVCDNSVKRIFDLHYISPA